MLPASPHRPSGAAHPDAPARDPGVATSTYLQSQATISAVINVIVNPTLSWLANRDMEPARLPSIAIDMSITCLVMSLAIAYLVGSAVERQVRSGALRGDAAPPGARLRSRLPRSWWGLGLSLGAGFALVLVPLSLLLFRSLGLSELPFSGVVVFKAL